MITSANFTATRSPYLSSPPWQIRFSVRGFILPFLSFSLSLFFHREKREQLDSLQFHEKASYEVEQFLCCFFFSFLLQLCFIRYFTPFSFSQASLAGDDFFSIGILVLGKSCGNLYFLCSSSSYFDRVRAFVTFRASNFDLRGWFIATDDVW